MPRFISLNIEYFFYQLYRFYYSFTHANPSAPDFSIANLFTSSIFYFVSLLSVLLLTWIIIYLLIKTRQFHTEQEWVLHNLAQERKAIPEENPKWKSVTQFTESQNPSDWKIAVIEADKMLDDALVASGFSGESLGERLKNLDSKSSPWVEDAWDAHKIRNRIAHETDFVLDSRDTRKAITKYERALRELRAI